MSPSLRPSNNVCSISSRSRSPADGRRVVLYTDGGGTGPAHVFVWDGDLKREIGRLPVTDMLLAAVSADGSRIATTDRDGTSVRVWDTDSLELLLILSDDDQHGGGIAFTPDGRLIAGRSSGGLTIWETRKPFCAACPPGVTRR